LRIGRVWEVRDTQKGFRDPPSPIALFDVAIHDTLTLTPGKPTGTEELHFDEALKMRDGSSGRCQADATVTVAVRYGRRGGDAAVQIDRPSLRAQRRCQPPGIAEPVLESGPVSARFVLRGDQLVAFQPAAEKRRFIPVE
jgi:hypothetical protein